MLARHNIYGGPSTGGSTTLFLDKSIPGETMFGCDSSRWPKRHKKGVSGVALYLRRLVFVAVA